MNGIFHNNLKEDNVLVLPDGKPTLIDFSEASIIDGDNQPMKWLSNLENLALLLKDLHNNFEMLLDKVNKAKKIAGKNRVMGYAILSDLFKQFEGATLDQRPKIVEAYFKKNEHRLVNLISFLSVPNSLRKDVIFEFNDLLGNFTK